MKSSTIQVRVPVAIERDGEGYHGYAPALRGCHVGGASVEETSRNLDDAVTLYLAALIERGIPLPIGCETEMVQEQVVEHSVPSRTGKRGQPHSTRQGG